MLVVATQRPEPLAEGSERRLENFAELVALALASADARNELAASRARIVEAGDEARRRLERDLHDGAQQRLVALSLTLRLARARLEKDPAAAVDAARVGRRRARQGARAAARGRARASIRRCSATAACRPALEALAGRAPFIVDLDVADERFGHALEVAVYYLVSEALTNAAKHAERARGGHDRAARGRPPRRADRRRRRAAAPTRRAAPGCAAWPTASPRSAAGCEIDSPPGGGTVVRAELPLALRGLTAHGSFRAATGGVRQVATRPGTRFPEEGERAT